jgi:hypothetical protein
MGLCHVAVVTGVVKTGAYRYQDGTQYVGDWNQRGQKHGMGHLCLSDGTRYDGSFHNGLCAGLGVMCFPDGAKYECLLLPNLFDCLNLSYSSPLTHFDTVDTHIII